MSASRPLFSIVMPTRERASLLKFALQSALSQTFDDYEIVISDNASADGTRAVVGELADERVRYFRVDKRLSMPENWEFALEQARGEYVTYLSDDDAFRPTLLEKLYPLMEGTTKSSVSWMGGMYYHPDWPSDADRHKLLLTPTSGEVQEFSSCELLKSMFALDYKQQFPRLLNSCCPRSLLEERKRRMGGSIFRPTCPDYSVAVATLTAINSGLYLDENLVVYGAALKSNGSYGFDDSDALQIFMDEFPNLEDLWRIPLRLPTQFNHVAVTLTGLKEVLGRELASYSLSIPNLFKRAREEIELLEARGANTHQMRQHWDEALADQPLEMQRAVREDKGTLSPSQRAKLWGRKRFPKVARALTGRAETRRGGMRHVEELRFDNIFEAAKVIENVSHDAQHVDR